jgi:glutamine amidotransferase
VRIAICDVGHGNLRSVERALLRAAASALPSSASTRVEIALTHDPVALRSADKIVMPGQGAFGDCARGLANGLGDVVRERIMAGVPYLGICLGLQVLFGSSEEAQGCAGLGIFDGDVARIEEGTDETTGGALKIPHVGWNAAEPCDARGLLRESAEHFYFVHSYVVRPRDARVIAATTEYGARFVSAIAKDNVFACQFHPEKSQRAGHALLERFVRL